MLSEMKMSVDEMQWKSDLWGPAAPMRMVLNVDISNGDEITRNITDYLSLFYEYLTKRGHLSV